MSAISNTLEIGPPGQTIAKPCPRRFTRRYALIRSARPVESMKPTLERSTTSGRSRSAKASLRAEIMRGAVAISSSPRTASSSYPSTRLRSTASGITAAASLCDFCRPRALRSGRGALRLPATLARHGGVSRRGRQPHLPGARPLRRGRRGRREGQEGPPRRRRRAHRRAPRGAGGQSWATCSGTWPSWPPRRVSTSTRLAEENLAKLLSRQERNVLQGSGDTR